MFHPLESVFFVERNVTLVLRHPFNVQIVPVFFFDTLQQLSGNALPLIIRVDQYIVNLRQHLAVIQRTDQTYQPVTVPCGQDGGRVHQSLVQPLRILAGYPADRQKQLLHLLLCKILFFRIVQHCNFSSMFIGSRIADIATWVLLFPLCRRCLTSGRCSAESERPIFLFRSANTRHEAEFHHMICGQ